MRAPFLPLLISGVLSACVPSRNASTVSSHSAPRAAPLPGAPTGVTAFVDVSVIPMDRERVLAHQTVLVEGGWITTIGPSARVPVPVGATQIDGRGRYLMPGLADMHAHIMAGADSANGEQRLFLWIANGVTTIRNMDFSTTEGLMFRARAARGELVSPRIYTSGLANIDPDNRGEIGARIAAYKAAGYDFVKMKHFDRETFDSVVAAARRVGIPIAGHLDGLRLADGLNAKYASIEHLMQYLEELEIPPTASDPAPAWGPDRMTPDGFAWQRRHTDFSKIPALVSATKRAGVWNCPTEAIYENMVPENSNETLLAWPELRYYSQSHKERALMLRDVLATGTSSVGRGQLSPDGEFLSMQNGSIEARRLIIKTLQDSSAGLLLGTDNAELFIIAGFGVHRELQALVNSGLTPYQALATGTRNPAVFLHTLDVSGTIEAGKWADLVLLRANPLEDIRHSSEIAGVMFRGRWMSREDIDRRLPEFVGAM